MIALPMPSDLPQEPTEIAAKIAAAQAAQATAAAAQSVANECQHEADVATGAVPPDLAHTINTRIELSETTQAALHLLRKINSANK